MVNPSTRSVTNLDLDTNRSLMFFNKFQQINSISASPKRARYAEEESSDSRSMSSSKYLNLERSDKFSNLVEYLQDKLSEAMQKKVQTKLKYSRRSRETTPEAGAEGELTRPSGRAGEAGGVDQAGQGNHEVDDGVD